MKWTVRIIQGLLIIGFLLFGFMKLSANPMQVEAFNTIYGYGTAFMYIVGFIEVIGAIGLLIGYWKKKLITIFSGLLIIVMVGAIITHLQAGQGLGATMPSIIFLILSAFVFWGQRKIN